jgi:hypothetical protein
VEKSQSKKNLLRKKPFKGFTDNSRFCPKQVWACYCPKKNLCVNDILVQQNISFFVQSAFTKKYSKTDLPIKLIKGI